MSSYETTRPPINDSLRQLVAYVWEMLAQIHGDAWNKLHPPSDRIDPGDQWAMSMCTMRPPHAEQALQLWREHNKGFPPKTAGEFLQLWRKLRAEGRAVQELPALPAPKRDNSDVAIAWEQCQRIYAMRCMGDGAPSIASRSVPNDLAEVAQTAAYSIPPVNPLVVDVDTHARAFARLRREFEKISNSC